jgi:hypothetical protein
VSLEVPFVCIVGAPRSGTTWLQAMLGAHPLVCTAQELKVFDLFTAPWERAWQQLGDLQRTAGGGRRGLRIVWSDEEFYAVLSELLERVYARVLATKPGATVLLDKSPGYSKHVAHIRHLVPQVKFIHVLRDGRDVAASLRAGARSWARAWAPGAIRAGAALWRTTVLDAREARRFGPVHYVEVRYEALLRNGPAVLRDLFAFIGVPATVREAAAICEEHTLERMRESGGHPFDLPRDFFRSGRVGGWRHELTPRERYLVHDAAGDLLCELGYADGSWWFERGYQRWLVPALTGGPARRHLRHLLHGVRALRRAGSGA